MAQPIMRKKCTVTAETVGANITLTPTTNDKSPAHIITNFLVTYAGGGTADFFSGSGRFEVIIRRL